MKGYKMKPITVHGTEYRSLKAASEATGISWHYLNTIRKKGGIAKEMLAAPKAEPDTKANVGDIAPEYYALMAKHDTHLNGVQPEPERQTEPAQKPDDAAEPHTALPPYRRWELRAATEHYREVRDGKINQGLKLERQTEPAQKPDDPEELRKAMREMRSANVDLRAEVETLKSDIRMYKRIINAMLPTYGSLLNERSEEDY